MEPYWDNLGWVSSLSTEENLLYDAIYLRWTGRGPEAIEVLKALIKLIEEKEVQQYGKEVSAETFTEAAGEEGDYDGYVRSTYH